MASIIQPFALRRDTANNWSTKNPTLLEGQEGYETDTRKRKVGAKDASGNLIPWNGLPYDVSETTGTGGGSTGPTLQQYRYVDGAWTLVNVTGKVFVKINATDPDPEIGTGPDQFNGATDILHKP